jgi:mannose-6-phosphate isomerase-like protein (cupin superfamily)
MRTILSHLKRETLIVVITIILNMVMTINAESQYLKRSLSAIAEVNTGLCSVSAHYKPVFGEGDTDSEIIKGLTRYGQLVIDPGGESKSIKYAGEELIFFILDGTGILNMDKVSVPVCRNDFMYIPKGMKFGFSNPREQPLSLIIMGFRLFPDTCKWGKPELMIANCEEVKFQTLPSHGPTTTFQLLLGTTESTRDRLAAACRVTSLFIMDFATGGTNIPHKHDKEEEVYLILRGHGDIVAGEKDDGEGLRHTSNQGDVYFFSPKTRIGFYSGNSAEEEHARILAVRFNYSEEIK